MPMKPNDPKPSPVDPREIQEVRKALLGFLRVLAGAVAQRLRERAETASPSTQRPKRQDKRRRRR